MVRLDITDKEAYRLLKWYALAGRLGIELDKTDMALAKEIQYKIERAESTILQALDTIMRLRQATAPTKS